MNSDQIWNLAKRAAVRVSDKRPLYAVVHAIDGIRADIIYGESRTMVRNARIVGDITGIAVGDTVQILWWDAGRPVVTAISDNGDIYARLERLELQTAAILPPLPISNPSSGEGIDLQKVILLSKADGISYIFQPDEVGLAEANAQAAIDDTIYIPSTTITYDLVEVAGVSYVGFSRKNSIIDGTVTGANGASLISLSVLGGFTGTAVGTTYLFDSDIHGTGVTLGEGQVKGWGCLLSGTSYGVSVSGIYEESGDPTSTYRAVDFTASIFLNPIGACNRLDMLLDLGPYTLPGPFVGVIMLWQPTADVLNGFTAQAGSYNTSSSSNNPSGTYFERNAYYSPGTPTSYIASFIGSPAINQGFYANHLPVIGENVSLGIGSQRYCNHPEGNPATVTVTQMVYYGPEIPGTVPPGDSEFLFCKIYGGSLDIYNNSDAAVSVYACQFDPTKTSGFIEEMWGDRGAFDVANFPERHASDIFTGLSLYHLPEATNVGDTAIWDGTNWVASSTGTSGGGGGDGSGMINPMIETGDMITYEAGGGLGDNVATLLKGAHAIASSEYQPTLNTYDYASYAIDVDEWTAGHTGGWNSAIGDSLGDTDPWIRIALPSEMVILGWKMYQAGPTHTADEWCAASYKVQVSNDDSTWTDVVTHSPSEPNDIHYVTFATPQRARYFKFVGLTAANPSYPEWAVTFIGLYPSTSEGTIRLPIGDEGEVLTSVSGMPSWEPPANSGHDIQDEGTPLTERTNLNFVGSSVAVTDDSGNDATVVTITPVTLASDADSLLGITGQQLTLDTQTANTVLAGPTSGGAADPTFRSLVTADLPTSVLIRQAVFSYDGTLTVIGGGLRIYNLFGYTLTISQVYIAVATAPTGAAIIVDVNKGGTTIFTNQAHRPQIAAAANTGSASTIDIPSWANGEYLTVDIDQIGSGTVGASLTVTIVCS